MSVHIDSQTIGSILNCIVLYCFCSYSLIRLMWMWVLLHLVFIPWNWQWVYRAVVLIIFRCQSRSKTGLDPRVIYLLRLRSNSLTVCFDFCSFVFRSCQSKYKKKKILLFYGYPKKNLTMMNDLISLRINGVLRSIFLFFYRFMNHGVK